MSAASDNVNAAFIKSAFEVKAQRDEALATLRELTDYEKRKGLFDYAIGSPTDNMWKRAHALIKKAKKWT